jgi:MOSC domain-containing protein YiiM
MQISIHSIATSKNITYTIGAKTFQSGYKKDIYCDSINVNHLGLKDDTQVDTRYHGGIDKAIHIGSTKHFNIFKSLYNKDLDPLAFGCNILINDFDENDICVGDIYSIGEVKIEVSQPRQICWKVGALFGKEVSRYCLKNQATGWYVRVLKEGTINISDTMKLEKRVSDITIKELSTYLYTPPQDNKLIKKILDTPALADTYKKDFFQVLNQNNS